MNAKQYDIFFILLKLKSYLLSLIEDPGECIGNFKYTEEFLQRKYPSLKDKIIDLLIENDINNDCDIALDSNIHNKFIKIAKENSSLMNLDTILSKFDIRPEQSIKTEQFENFIKERDNSLKDIIELLLQLSKNWSVHRELEHLIDNYFILEEEEVLRKDELSKLDKLALNATESLKQILNFTKRYLEYLVDYYFRYGGDLPLHEFVTELENIKKIIAEKYIELFNQSGLDSDYFESEK